MPKIKFDKHDPHKPATYTDGSRTYEIHYVNAPLFDKYVAPNGVLDTNIATHALFRYYLMARQTWEQVVADQITYEGTPDNVANFRQLFEGVAAWYGVLPEEMAKCWDMVDAQCTFLGLPKLPDEERYRFDRASVIKGN